MFTKVLTINLRQGEPGIYLPAVTRFTYPKGESQVRLTPETATQVREADMVMVWADVGSAKDLIDLALLKNAIDNTATVYTRLVLPYLPYGRADRPFTDGDCCGLEVFGQIVNGMNFDEVVTLDAHNRDKAKLYIGNLIDRSPEEFIHCAITEHAHRHNSDRITVLFPDDGARARYHIPDGIVGSTGQITIDVLNCEKKRNPVTGVLEGFDVPGLPPGQPAIIIDDICDGGGTFVGIGKMILAQFIDYVPTVGLYVTHGIFSKGYGELNTYFDQIYTTDSIGQHGPDKLVTVFSSAVVLNREETTSAGN